MSDVAETLETCRVERDQLRTQVDLLTRLKQPMPVSDNAYNGPGEKMVWSALWQAREEIGRLQDLGVKVVEAVTGRSPVPKLPDLIREQVNVVSLRNKSLATENSDLKQAAKRDREMLETERVECSRLREKYGATWSKLVALQMEEERYKRDMTAQAELIKAKAQMALLQQKLEDEQAATGAAARKCDRVKEELVKLKEQCHDIEQCKRDVTAARGLAALEQSTETPTPVAISDTLKEQIEAVRLRNKQLREEINKLKADGSEAQQFESDTRRTLILTNEVARLKGKVAELEVSVQLDTVRSEINKTKHNTELKKLQQAVEAELASSQTENKEHDRVLELLETAKSSLAAQQTAYDVVVGDLDLTTTQLSTAQEAIREAQQATAQAITERDAKEQEIKKLKKSRSTITSNGPLSAGQESTETGSESASKKGGKKGSKKGGKNGKRTSNSGITKPTSGKPRATRLTEAEKLLRDQNDWYPKVSSAHKGFISKTKTTTDKVHETRAQKKKREEEEQEKLTQQQAGASTTTAGALTAAADTGAAPGKTSIPTITTTDFDAATDNNPPETSTTASGSVHRPGEAQTEHVLGRRPTNGIPTTNGSLLQLPPLPPSPMSPKPDKRKNWLGCGGRMVKRARIY